MPTRKVYMLPTVEQAKTDTSNSIHQIVLQLDEHLSEFGWEITDNPHTADLHAYNAGQSYEGTHACDVAHCHGLYPTYEQRDTKWWFGANHNVIETLRYARAITVPSDWVNEIIKRELNRSATIVNWSIDFDSWRRVSAEEWRNGGKELEALASEIKRQKDSAWLKTLYGAKMIEDSLYSKIAPDVAEKVKGIIATTLDFDKAAHVLVTYADRYLHDTVEHRGYTLWNKTRADSTCDPSPIEYLASKLPNKSFITTFASNATPPPNLQVIGRQTFPKMKEVVQLASLYLATTKETFGIGTLEAMACGIPVLGYNWGGTADIVEHGVTGYLVEPNDLEGLLAGWHWCMKNRQVLSKNARKAALNKHYTWQRVAQQFAEVYDETWEAIEAERHQQIKVSVVIPVYNYAEWLPDAVKTVANQVTNFKFEICIVDDGSSDNSFEVAVALKEQYKEKCNILVCHKPNEGVAIARDYGIKTTIGKYIVCLDADDLLGDFSYLQTLYEAMEADKLLGAAYSSLAIFKGNPNDGCTVSAWPSGFDGGLQLTGHNQVPTCCMIRRLAYEQTGGYRKHFTPAEDAGLWYSLSLLGWTIRQVSTKPMFLYRLHDNSLSSVIRKGEKLEPKWTHQSDAATANRYPMAAQISPLDKNLPSHPVRNYDRPLISVIIPVGSRHKKEVSRALDSVASQTEWRHETIVVNDTGEKLEVPQRWAKLINANGATPKGAGAARNLGLKSATGRFVVFLDADDALEPTFLEKAYQMYRAKGRYIYSDWYEEKEGKLTAHTAQDYSQNAIFKRMSIHAVTVFIPRDWVLNVGGFDESLEAWEDSELFIKLAIAGYCGERVPEPLLVYNFNKGARREYGAANSEALKAVFRQKFGEYLEGSKMAAACCGRKALPKNGLINYDNETLVRVMLQNGKLGAETLRGAVSRKNYGVKRDGEIFLMLAVDAASNPETFLVIADDEHTIKPTPTPASPVAL